MTFWKLGLRQHFLFFDRMKGTTCFTGAVSETGGLDKMSLQLSAPKTDRNLDRSKDAVEGSAGAHDFRGFRVVGHVVSTDFD